MKVSEIYTDSAECRKFWDDLKFVGGMISEQVDGLYVIGENGNTMRLDNSWDCNCILDFVRDNIILENWIVLPEESTLASDITPLQIIKCVRDRYPELSLYDAKKLVIDRPQEIGYRLAIQHLKEVGRGAPLIRLLNDADNLTRQLKSSYDEQAAKVARIRAAMQD